MSVRPATPADAVAMVDLSEEKRTRYESYQPVFWRKAEGSREKQLPFFEQLVSNERFVALVHESNGVVDGFLIGQIVPAPPVYNPGGPSFYVDDYWVAGGQDWDSAGTALLDAACAIGRERGAAQAVVVCGHLDQPKRSMLYGNGYTIASEWYVKPLRETTNDKPGQCPPHPRVPGGGQCYAYGSTARPPNWPA